MKLAIVMSTLMLVFAGEFRICSNYNLVKYPMNSMLITSHTSSVM